MTTDKPKNELPQGDDAIKALLSNPVTEAIIASANEQYIRYAPCVFPFGFKSSRSEQAGRFLYEFVAGAPSKAGNYIGCILRQKPSRIGRLAGLPAAVLTGLSLYVKAMGLAFKGCVIVGDILLVPKDDLIRRLRQNDQITSETDPFL